MQLSLDIARRYLFGKKSTNAINIISWISVVGVTIGTAALLLILSVFNGFEGLISGLFNAFNPDLLITPVQGKVFEDKEELYTALLEIEGVREVSRTLEEIVLFQYGEVQEVGVIKGVDQQYNRVTAIDSTIRRGVYKLADAGVNYAISGMGMANKLGVSVEEGFMPIVVYIPKLGGSNPFSRNYNSQVLYPAATFSVQTEQDFQYVISNLEFVQRLREDQKSIGAYEISLDPDIKEWKVRNEIESLLGSGFVIKNRFEQDEAFLKLMNIEKWVSFALAGFAFVLIAFNLVGCLWMIVLDKQHDIAILKAMGFTDGAVQWLFIIEGMLICGIGILSGLILSVIFYFLQREFGIIGIPAGFIIDAYPIEMRFFDIFIVSITVFGIGMLASLPASFRAKAVKSYIREE